MRTKLQHYVPQFYLEGFADPEQPRNIWVYEKGRPTPRSQGIKGTAAENYYYSLNQPSGEKDDLLEREVLSRVETQAAPVLLRWRTDQRPVVTEEDIRSVSPFLATCWVRSPRMRQDTDEVWTVLARNIIQDALEDDQFLEEYLKSHPNEKMSKKELREALKAGLDPRRITIKLKKNISTGFPFLMADEIIPFITERHWTILEAPSEIEFVTSDSPLSVFELSSGGRALIGVGIGRPRAELTLPFCPSRALHLSSWVRTNYRRITPEAAREINRRVAAQAHRYVYARRKSKRIDAIVQEFAFTLGRPRIDVVEFRKAYKARKRARSRNTSKSKT